MSCRKCRQFTCYCNKESSMHNNMVINEGLETEDVVDCDFLELERVDLMELLTSTESESDWRKKRPLFSGCMNYFPDALMEVAHLSWVANEKHNPGEELHWSKHKSNDHLDCAMRHAKDAGYWDCSMSEPVRHSTQLAWRALANLQTELDKERDSE